MKNALFLRAQFKSVLIYETVVLLLKLYSNISFLFWRIFYFKK